MAYAKHYGLPVQHGLTVNAVEVDAGNTGRSVCGGERPVDDDARSRIGFRSNGWIGDAAHYQAGLLLRANDWAGFGQWVGGLARLSPPGLLRWTSRGPSSAAKMKPMRTSTPSGNSSP